MTTASWAPSTGTGRPGRRRGCPRPSPEPAPPATAAASPRDRSSRMCVHPASVGGDVATADRAQPQHGWSRTGSGACRRPLRRARRRRLPHPDGRRTAPADSRHPHRARRQARHLGLAAADRSHSRRPRGPIGGLADRCPRLGVRHGRGVRGPGFKPRTSAVARRVAVGDEPRRCRRRVIVMRHIFLALVLATSTTFAAAGCSTVSTPASTASGPEKAISATPSSSPTPTAKGETSNDEYGRLSIPTTAS